MFVSRTRDMADLSWVCPGRRERRQFDAVVCDALDRRLTEIVDHFDHLSFLDVETYMVPACEVTAVAHFGGVTRLA